MQEPIDELVATHFRNGRRHIPGRLQAAIALLERLVEFPSLDLDTHLTKSKAALMSHETFGDRALSRMRVVAINKNHGRRSSNVQDWGATLLRIIGDAGFGDASAKKRKSILRKAQSRFGHYLKSILEQEPFLIRTTGRSAESVIRELLEQAEEKGKSGDVAQYLVASKLEMRFRKDLPLHGANRRDSRGRIDPNAREGDFEIGDSVIEVAMGLPDEHHIKKISNILEQRDKEVWLLTRSDRVSIWKAELREADSELRQVVVRSVDGFVGQNITEMGVFSAKERANQLISLFKRYNTRWIPKFGNLSGLKIANSKGKIYE